MRRKRRDKPFHWILIVLLLLPILAACGGGGDSSADANPTSQPPEAEPTSQTTTVAEAEPTSETTVEDPTPTVADTGGTPATEQSNEPAGDKILRIHQLYYPSIIDPQKSSFIEDISVMLLNYEGLTVLDENQETVPGAAESWEYNDDATRITFTLHDDLMYSDGSPLTAENFRYAVERTCDPNTAGDYQSILFEIVGCAEFAETDPADTAAYDEAKSALGVQAPDDTTLVIDLTQPAPYYHTVASIWVFFPAKKELIEQGGEAWWQQPELHIGNGPFRITGIEADQLITFVANENYREGRPILDGIEYVYQADSTVALEAYKQGQLHIMLTDPSQLAAIQEDPELSAELVQYPVAATLYLMFNLTKEPFDDLNVREAFAYAFDRATFCEQIRSGDCSPTFSFIPEGVPGAIETDAFAFDPDAARAALAASSYGGPEDLPEITLSYVSDNPAEQPRVEWIAGQFRDILGVTITLEPLESTAWVATLDDPEILAQITGLGWGQDYPDPQNWLSIVWTCDGINAAAGYCSEEFDNLTTQGDIETDQATRLGYYEQAGELLVNELPAVFLNNPLNIFLVSPEVTGYDHTSADWSWPGERTSVMTMDLDE